MPFIKLLKFGDSHYVYDVNKNDIIKISYESYIILQKIINNNSKINKNDLNKELEVFRKEGYFSKNQIQQIKNIEVKEILNLLNSNLKSLLIQVTRDCNLRCKYCFYSGKYTNIRTHEMSYMKKELCMQIIDYFMLRSIRSSEINIGFYGGEPLLNFKLIKETVEYIEEKYPLSNIKYSITTNATLLTPYIIEYLIKKNFLITISIDGPQNIHDANRIFANGSGSYNIVYKNIKYIFDNKYDYFISNIRYNAVVTHEYKMVEDYFKNEPILGKIRGKLSPLNNYHDNSLVQNQNSREFDKEKGISTYNKTIRMLVNYLKNKNQGNYNGINTIKQTIDKLNVNYEYPQKAAISAGVCIPGISRLFCTTNGDFYMCEKLDDNSQDLKIGDIHNGWNIKNIVNLSNISNSSKDKGCKNCWAIHLCNMCAAKIYACNEEKLNKKCDEVRKGVERDLINICKLIEIKKESIK